MTHLDPSQLEQLRTDLLTTRSALLREAAFLSEEDAVLRAEQSSGAARPRSEGDGDATAVERDLNAQLSAASRTALADVDAALARIAEGSYGRCAGCGGEIPFGRLEVRPRAATCVKCADRYR
jgi:DnaK suppressor protein